jgi:hypothetical protein
MGCSLCELLKKTADLYPHPKSTKKNSDEEMKNGK